MNNKIICNKNKTEKLPKTLLLSSEGFKWDLNKKIEIVVSKIFYMERKKNSTNF